MKLFKLLNATSAIPAARLLLLVFALPIAAHADLVDIKWAAGAFSHKASIAPKQFTEICGKLKRGDRVAWQFKGSAPSDFNIHYHVGNEVSYAENRKQVADADATLSVPQDQHYCWMWSNVSQKPVDIEVNLTLSNAGN